MKYKQLVVMLNAEIMNDVLENKDLVAAIFGVLGNTLTGTTYKSILFTNKLFCECIKKVFPNADTVLVDHLREIMRLYKIKEYEEMNVRMPWNDFWNFPREREYKKCSLAIKRTDVPCGMIYNIFQKTGRVPLIPNMNFEDYMKLWDENNKIPRSGRNFYKYANAVVAAGIYPADGCGIDNNKIKYLNPTVNIGKLCERFSLEELRELSKKESTFGDYWSSFEVFACMLPNAPYDFVIGIEINDWTESWIIETNSDPELVFKFANKHNIPRFIYLCNNNIDKYPELKHELSIELSNYIVNVGYDGWVYIVIERGKLPLLAINDATIPIFLEKYQQFVYNKPLSLALSIHKRYNLSERFLYYSLENCTYTYKDVTPEMMGCSYQRYCILRNPFRQNVDL